MTFGWPHLCDGAWCWEWGPGMELGVFLCVVCSPMCFPITEWQLWKWGRHGTGRKEEQTEQPKNILLEGESRCCWAPTSLPAPASAPKESVVSKQWSQGSWWQERLRLKSYRHRWGWRLIRNGSGSYQMKDRPRFAFTVVDLKKKKEAWPQNMRSCGHLLDRQQVGPQGRGLQGGCFHCSQQGKPGPLKCGFVHEGKIKHSGMGWTK